MNSLTKLISLLAGITGFGTLNVTGSPTPQRVKSFVEERVDIIHSKMSSYAKIGSKLTKTQQSKFMSFLTNDLASEIKNIQEWMEECRECPEVLFPQPQKLRYNDLQVKLDGELSDILSISMGLNKYLPNDSGLEDRLKLINAGLNQILVLITPNAPLK